MAQPGGARPGADQHDAVDVGRHCYSSSSSSRERLFDPEYSRAGTDSLGVGGGGGGGSLVSPAMRRVAMWRITPSVILSTRETSSRVAGSDANVSRW